ncbi:MAG: hypothetical protein KGJ84_02990 [Elusimicrobia bacterium]|nr:hypothetical protein [Elusimicrobiota bacterium]
MTQAAKISSRIAELEAELEKELPAPVIYSLALPHLRYHDFADFGVAEAYRAKWKKLRAELTS